MAHDVFISYSHHDKTVADAACAALEASKIRCWVAPRDVLPGRDWSASIVGAINESKVVLLILSEHSNVSVWVRKEVERAVSKGIAVLPLRIEDVTPNEHLELFVSGSHWLDALIPPLENHLERLAMVISQLVSLSEPLSIAELSPTAPDSLREPIAGKREMDSTNRKSETIPFAEARLPAQTTAPDVLLPIAQAGLDTSQPKLAITATDNPVPPDRPLSARGNVELIEIPAGEFIMGSEKSHEKPMRKVFLDAYRIGRLPVTVGQYKAYCADAVIDFAKFPKPDWGWIDDHPMVNVTRQQARDFCIWAGGDLPTEAQWEKAARGVDGREYPWGNEFDPSRLHCKRKGFFDANVKSTAPVGSFPSGASPWGCLDMAGNASEWCLDWYGRSYAGLADRNPTGPSSGNWGVLRGGSWFDNRSSSFRSAARRWQAVACHFGTLGFRLAGPIT